MNRLLPAVFLTLVLPIPLLAQVAGPATATVGSKFVSTDKGGKWSELATWKTQDGQAPTRVPSAGDTVAIDGLVTVDSAVTVGTGTGDALTFTNGAKLGDRKLTISAPLTVRGNLLVSPTAVIEVEAGAGIELDGAAGATPSVSGAAGSIPQIFFRGTDQKRCFFRTKAGTAGTAGYAVTAMGATYTDFTDLGNKKDHWGIDLRTAKDMAVAKLDHCDFNRANLRVFSEVPYELSHCILSDTPGLAQGDLSFGVQLIGKGQLNVTACSFDKLPWLELVKDIRSTVFYGGVFYNGYAGAPHQAWSDNLVLISDPANGYFKATSATYRRTYFICSAKTDNPHVSGSYGDAVFEQCLWDVPICEGAIDDAMMMLWTKSNVTITRCLSLPRLGGKNPQCGVSLGFIGGGAGSSVKYSHNTIALGQVAGINSDRGHGGVENIIAELKNNIFYTLEGVKDPGVVLNTDVPNVLSGANADYNALFRSDYGPVKFIKGQPGANDVKADPKFVDPTRCLIQFYRSQSGRQADTVEKDLTSALEWIRVNPSRMPEMIDWVFAGYVPTNPALKAASDQDGPTKGWIGAMEGKAATSTSQPASAPTGAK